jgi:hypothetical protein
MTAIENYFSTAYEQRRELIKKRRISRPETSEVYSRLRDMLSQADYENVIEVLQADDDDYAYEGYKQGFKDGMKFLLNMVTE